MRCKINTRDDAEILRRWKYGRLMYAEGPVGGHNPPFKYITVDTEIDDKVKRYEPEIEVLEVKFHATSNSAVSPNG